MTTRRSSRQRRHTIDLRVAEALPAASPVFKSASVSQYRMGLWAPDENDQYRDDENELINPVQPSKPDKLYQLQVNAPNLPMFSLGTLPFLGDYIDIAGQTFVTDDQRQLGVQHVFLEPARFLRHVDGQPGRRSPGRSELGRPRGLDEVHAADLGGQSW